MNKILDLFDKQYVLDLFNREILPLYPDFVSIKNLEIKPAKKNVWATTYHVVIEFPTTFLRADGSTVELSIYSTAHSNEPRKNSFEALTYLWNRGFNRGDLTIPRPLFFSEHFNGYFYRGVQGKNLYYYIREKNRAEIEKIIPRASAWFAKLHGLPVESAKNFNKINSRVNTVIPGYELIFANLREHYPDHFETYEKTFNYILEKEKNFLGGRKTLWLIHGDAHPENVIKMSENTTAVIDFTDICLADFARDLGAFTQQLEYMSSRKFDDPYYVARMQKLFLDSYFSASGIKPDEDLLERIGLYNAWTSLRTATLFLLKQPAEPERAHELLDKARRDLRLV